MTTTFHTPIPTGAAANASTINNPLGALDAAIMVQGGGANASDAALRAWTEAGAYELTAITYDSNGVVTTATVKWPDGSAGILTATTKNSTWLAVDAYTISHTDSGKTVTQAMVTRDGNGAVTVKPPLTVA